MRLRRGALPTLGCICQCGTHIVLSDSVLPSDFAPGVSGSDGAHDDTYRTTSSRNHGFAKADRGPKPDPRYSTLRAVTGEIDAARVAGMMAAKKAQRASALAATVRANGSQLATP